MFDFFKRTKKVVTSPEPESNGAGAKGGAKTAPFVASVHEKAEDGRVTERAMELLVSQKFRRSASNESAHILGAELIMSGQADFMVGGGIDFTRGRKGSGVIDLVGLVLTDNRGADDPYIVACEVTSEGTGMPRYMKAREFLQQIGQQDVIEFLNKLRPASFRLTTIASSSSRPI